jgi:Cu-processing system ATP-binding protein
MIVSYGLTKTYGSVEVLRGVDLRIARGRVTAIVGPNGAGKTTLIKALLGLTRPDAGSLTFDGAEIGDDAAYRARIGYMPQIARFPESLTGNELLDLLRDLRGNRSWDEQLIDQLAVRASLDKKLRVLSGGTRQKINAVAAFLFAPDLYVLDEPTSGLDPLSASILKARIDAERRVGRTIILTSHILSEIDELADDIVYLCDGTVHFAGGVLELKRQTRALTVERAIAALMRREVAA